MGKYVKCKTCQENVLIKEKTTLMDNYPRVSAETGKVKNNWCHKGECYEKFIAHQAFLDEELNKQNELDLVVKEIHQVNFPLPRNYWTMIQDIRNGTTRYKRDFKKHYREGVGYDVLKEAYLMSRQNIEWARLNKRFKNLEAELRYCLIIAHSKVNDAHKKMKRTEQSIKQTEAREEQFIEDMMENRVVKFKKQKSEFDISHILGDD